MTEGALQPVTEWLDFYGRTEKKDTINAIIEALGQINPTGNFAVGDILYASTVAKMARLAKGSTGQFLKQTATIPAWETVTLAPAISVISPHNITAANGATFFNTGLSTFLRMPSADTDTRFNFTAKLPENFTGTSVDVKFLYKLSSASTYQTQTSAGGTPVGNVYNETNIFSLDTAQDFPSATANTIALHTITLSDATDIAAGGIISMFIRSNASNAANLDIIAIWLEQT
ncbi:MAG: hypothetical protein V3U54_12945 [Thermodesulfobacteriota bacterium]